MRTLVVLPKSPVPPDNGGRQRMVHLLHALAARGPIDVIVGTPIEQDDRDDIAARFGGARVCAPPDPVPAHPRGRARWLSARALPLGAALLDPSDARRDARSFATAAEAPYDLLFAGGATAMWLFGRTVRGVPVVIDYADVTSVAFRRGYDVIRSTGDRRQLRTYKDLVRHRIEVDRWDRFERAQGAKANLVTVCSAADREALGVPGAVVVPNGYSTPAHPAGERPDDHGRAPVLVFAGQMTYGPNADGARWMAEEILPRLRSRVPGVRLDIVGRAGPEVQALQHVEGVRVCGFVDRIDDALRDATAVVVPLRQGSGTRIKILEAWAHRLPVVSTTIGAEGLGAVDGVDALLADDPDAFASACRRVLTDAGLRNRLAVNGAARRAADFDWEVIRSAFGALVDGIVEQATTYAGAGRPLIDEVADRHGVPHASPPLGGGA